MHRSGIGSGKERPRGVEEQGDEGVGAVSSEETEEIARDGAGDVMERKGKP